MQKLVRYCLVCCILLGVVCLMAAEKQAGAVQGVALSQTADSLGYFSYNGRVYVQNGVLSAPVAKLLQKEYIGETKALPDKGLGEHVPESANAIPQLCGNAGGMQVYTLHGVYSGSLLLVMDADGRTHLFKRK